MGENGAKLKSSTTACVFVPTEGSLMVEHFRRALEASQRGCRTVRKKFAE